MDGGKGLFFTVQRWHGPYQDGCCKCGDNVIFSLLWDILKEHDLRDKLSQIYNVDGTGVPLDPKPPSKIIISLLLLKEVAKRFALVI